MKVLFLQQYANVVPLALKLIGHTLNNRLVSHLRIKRKFFMQKIKDFVLSINFAILVLFMIGVRITVAGASIGDALALLGVCGLQAFYQWIETKKQKPLDEQVQKELSELKAYMSGMAIKNSIKTQPDQGMKRFF